jgi:hypothetical protein
VVIGNRHEPQIQVFTASAERSDQLVTVQLNQLRSGDEGRDPRFFAGFPLGRSVDVGIARLEVPAELEPRVCLLVQRQQRS